MNKIIKKPGYLRHHINAVRRYAVSTRKTVTSMHPHNEDSRVKIPALLHLRRLGYQYLSLRGVVWDKPNNIFPELFATAIQQRNENLSQAGINRLIEEIDLDLQNEDLGRAFYQRLTAAPVFG